MQVQNAICDRFKSKVARRHRRELWNRIADIAWFVDHSAQLAGRALQGVPAHPETSGSLVHRLVTMITRGATVSKLMISGDFLETAIPEFVYVQVTSLTAFGLGFGPPAYASTVGELSHEFPGMLTQRGRLKFLAWPASRLNRVYLERIRAQHPQVDVFVRRSISDLRGTSVAPSLVITNRKRLAADQWQACREVVTGQEVDAAAVDSLPPAAPSECLWPVIEMMNASSFVNHIRAECAVDPHLPPSYHHGTDDSWV